VLPPRRLASGMETHAAFRHLGAPASAPSLACSPSQFDGPAMHASQQPQRF
jgi:hypothetical protein